MTRISYKHIATASLFLILALASLLRFWKLGDIPMGITHDEMGYIYNAYSIAKTGKNVFGDSLPVFTWMSKEGFPFMPIPMYSMVPLFWVFPLTPMVARLLPAILGVLDVVLLYYIVKILFKSHNLALLSGFFLAISPWHLHFSRSAYDANYALFYFLVAIFSFLHEIPKIKKPWITVVAFAAAIFSYRGMSILFVPVAIVLYWYTQSTRSITSRQSLRYWVGVGVCVVLFAVPVFRYGNAYTAEGIAFFTNPKMQSDIDTHIREAKGPLLIRRLFANKPTYFIDRYRENYLKAYSPEFLFLYSEPNAIYSIWSRGRIYFIDLFFTILGAIFIYRLNKKSSLLWFGLFLIGGLPGGIGGMPYSSRNFLLSAIYPVLSAAGTIYLVQASRTKLFHIGAIICISILYSYAFSSYLYDYYCRYAHQGAEAWEKSIKEISLLAKEKGATFDLVLLGKTSFGDTVEYAFWNTIDPDVIQKTWAERQSLPFAYFTLGNIVFSEKCLDTEVVREPILIDAITIFYITSHTCKNDATPSGEIKDFYGNKIWNLFELDRQH